MCVINATFSASLLQYSCCEPNSAFADGINEFDFTKPGIVDYDEIGLHDWIFKGIFSAYFAYFCIASVHNSTILIGYAHFALPHTIVFSIFVYISSTT